jgi:hypothetical protein
MMRVASTGVRRAPYDASNKKSAKGEIHPERNTAVGQRDNGEVKQREPMRLSVTFEGLDSLGDRLGKVRESG